MIFSFDTKKTVIFQFLKMSELPFLRYAGVLTQLFLYLFLVCFLLISVSFFGVILISTIVLVKISIFLLFCMVLFWEIYLFVELKIKSPTVGIENNKNEIALDAALGQDDYNLAEFLSLESCRVIEVAIKICKKRKLSEVVSEGILYALLLESKDIQNLIFRLGIDIKKLQADLKNYLEKQKKQKDFTLSFSPAFQKTIKGATKVSVERGYAVIGEKELFVALAKNDGFFKKILVENDLKEKDIENISLWLDKLEQTITKNKKFWMKENLSKMGSLGRSWASGFTNTLDEFSIDWSRIASKNVFGEIIGHQKEIKGVEMVLAKSSLSNALILGDVGVGRKSIIQAISQRCYLGVSLPELNYKRVVELDMISLLSRIQDQENLENTLDRILQEALLSGNVILVIDELDNFVEQKTQKLGKVDISGILAKYLLIPNFHFIGIASFDGLHKRLEQNPSFLEYFGKVEVSEISELDTIRILQNLALGLEKKHKILITYPSVREIINLTARYMPSTPFPKKAIDTLEEAVVYVNSLKEKVILPHHIAKIVSDKTQIPIGKMNFKEKEVLINLENLIHQRIVNQQEAVNEISVAMRRSRSGISSKKRPMGTFLFLGPTGVGKTETAKALAEIYFGGEEKMIRLDMSEFQSISDIPRLIGEISPVEQQGLLTTPVRENPFSLVLLDEIEKTHPNILNLFLQVFDEGHITDGQGRKIIFNNTIIICTSNAGAQLIFEGLEKGDSIQKDKLFEFLFSKGIYKPEFINRFDAVVVFHPLTPENLMDIAQLMFLNIAKNLKEKEIDFLITENLKEKIVALSYKPEFGAREMRRVMQDTVENSIAKALLSDKITKGDTIEINPENFDIIKIVNNNSNT